METITHDLTEYAERRDRRSVRKGREDSMIEIRRKATMPFACIIAVTLAAASASPNNRVSRRNWFS